MTATIAKLLSETEKGMTKKERKAWRLVVLEDVPIDCLYREIGAKQAQIGREIYLRAFAKLFSAGLRLAQLRTL